MADERICITKVSSDSFSDASSIIADAFMNYPYPGEIVRDPHKRKDFLRAIMNYELERLNNHSTVESVDGGRAVIINCVYRDVHINESSIGYIRAVRGTVKLRELISLLNAYRSVDKLLKKVNIPDNAGYIHILAVSPEYQRNGIGSDLIRHSLERWDGEGRDSYLFTNTDHNVKLYGKLGFEEVASNTDKNGIYTCIMCHKCSKNL